jgi:uncharacterized protein YdaU (DUF1376 family)
VSKPPAFQFYPRDWVMSTRILTPEQRGIYLDLLCFGWDMENGLPSEPAELAALVGMTPPKFRKVWAVISSRFYQDEAGRWRNERQEEQKAELEQLRAKRRAAGRASAEQRANK